MPLGPLRIYRGAARTLEDPVLVTFLGSSLPPLQDCGNPLSSAPRSTRPPSVLTRLLVHGAFGSSEAAHGSWMDNQRFLRASRTYWDDVDFLGRLRRLNRLPKPFKCSLHFVRLRRQCKLSPAPTTPASPTWAIKNVSRFARLRGHVHLFVSAPTAPAWPTWATR